jgi:hypothetical protein
MFVERWAGIIETLELEYSIRCRRYLSQYNLKEK